MPQEGQILGDFALVREIGRGAVGAVWEATQRSLGRSVAIKFLSEAPRGDATWGQRFEAEAAQVARLSHPGILPVHALGHDDGTLWFAMELVRGRDLQEVLQDEGHVAPTRAAEIARDVALALAHAHDAGLVHRDVKPANIMVRDDGRVALTDFGLSKKLGSGALTTTGMLVGTPYYMSPEQVAGERDGVGPLSDVYGLGVTLYEMLTGKAPLHADNALALIRKITDDTPPAPNTVNAGIPAALSELTMACLAKGPEQRPASADALAAALSGFLQGTSIAEPVASSRAAAPSAALAAAEATTVAGNSGSSGPPSEAETSHAPLAVPSANKRRFNLLLSAVLIGAGIWLFKFSDRFGGTSKTPTEATPVQPATPASPTSPSTSGDRESQTAPVTSEADRVEVASLAWAMIRSVMPTSGRSSGPSARFVDRWRSDASSTMRILVDPPEARVEAFAVPTTQGYAPLADPAGSIPRAPGIYRIRCVHPGRVDTIASVILTPGTTGEVEITMPLASERTKGFLYMAGAWGTGPEGSTASGSPDEDASSTLRPMHERLAPHFVEQEIVSRTRYMKWVETASSDAERQRRMPPRPRRGGGPIARQFMVSSEMAQAFAAAQDARIPRLNEFAHLHWVTKMALWVHEFQEAALDTVISDTTRHEGITPSWRFSIWVTDPRSGDAKASPTIQTGDRRRPRGGNLPEGAPRQLALVRDAPGK